MQNAFQLTQEEAFDALTCCRIIEQQPAPPVLALQILVAHGPEDSFLFCMVRDPLLEPPGIQTLDAWKLVGPLDARKLVAGTLQSLISKRCS